MMGLERLIQTTYGTTPELNLDLKILKVRIPRPVAIDFPELAAGIHRNNVTPKEVVVQSRFEIREGRIRLTESGQEFQCEGEPRAGSRFQVLGFEPGEMLRAVPR